MGPFTTVDSYLEASSREAGAAAELAASNKVVKYAGLSSQGEFVPIVVESHGPVNRNALQFLSELGSWRLVETTGHVRASLFLFQVDCLSFCSGWTMVTQRWQMQSVLYNLLLGLCFCIEVRPHHAIPDTAALAEDAEADRVQAGCPGVQTSSLDGSFVSR